MNTKQDSSSLKRSLKTKKALKSVEIITDMLRKEQQAIKAAEHMKKDYEKLLHDKKVEEILYDSLGTDFSQLLDFWIAKLRSKSVLRLNQRDLL